MRIRSPLRYSSFDSFAPYGGLPITISNPGFSPLKTSKNSNSQINGLSSSFSQDFILGRISSFPMFLRWDSINFHFKLVISVLSLFFPLKPNVLKSSLFLDSNSSKSLLIAVEDDELNTLSSNNLTS